MRYSKFYLILVAVIGLSFYSCSDVKDDLTSPTTISVHGVNVLDPSSLKYHGLSVKEQTLESCKQCHAADFSGGTAEVSCITCHPALIIHHNDINNPTSSGFHGKFIASLNWDMSKCTDCHGNNYAGGVASPSCNTCHTYPGGPEACNTCHGNFTNPSLIAPPVDRNRNTVVTLASVGAHSSHLINSKIGTVKCSDCHVVPTALNSPGHIDSTPKAEVILTAKYSDYQVSTGIYDPNTAKCSNIYCHGNFSFSKATSQWAFAYIADKIEGENFQPTWNKVDGTQAACGTCHGLPPKGHMEADLRGCGTCHQGVVDEYGKIIDKTKHLNGKINVFGN